MGWLSGSPSAERSRSLLRCAWWRAILSGPSQFLRELHFIEAPRRICPLLRGPRLQFLRELHFIEASGSRRSARAPDRCSSFGNCTSLRRRQGGLGDRGAASQFLRELHFIEAPTPPQALCPPARRSSFGNCTSLRRRRHRGRSAPRPSQFLWELHFTGVGGD